MRFQIIMPSTTDSSKPGCTSADPRLPSGAERRSMRRTCYCNRVAYDHNRAICDVLCRSSAFVDCSCVNPRRAGFFCDEEVCANRGRFYCRSIGHQQSIVVGGARQLCTENVVVEKERVGEIPACPCGSGGELIDDRCSCKNGYSGIFCENYEYRPIAGVSTTPKSVDNTNNYILPLGIIGAVLIVAVVTSLCCKRKSNAAAARAAAEAAEAEAAVDPESARSPRPMWPADGEDQSIDEEDGVGGGGGIPSIQITEAPHGRGGGTPHRPGDSALHHETRLLTKNGADDDPTKKK